MLDESGTRVPVLQGGFNNYFGYRSFSLTVNFSYSIGNKIRLLRIASGEYSAVSPNRCKICAGSYESLEKSGR